MSAYQETEVNKAPEVTRANQIMEGNEMVQYSVILKRYIPVERRMI